MAALRYIIVGQNAHFTRSDEVPSAQKSDQPTRSEPETIARRALWADWFNLGHSISGYRTANQSPAGSAESFTSTGRHPPDPNISEKRRRGGTPETRQARACEADWRQPFGLSGLVKIFRGSMRDSAGAQISPDCPGRGR